MSMLCKLSKVIKLNVDQPPSKKKISAICMSENPPQLSSSPKHGVAFSEHK